MSDKTKAEKKRYYRKKVELFRLIDKIKLWPSRTGLLHGIRTVERMGDEVVHRRMPRLPGTRLETGQVLLHPVPSEPRLRPQRRESRVPVG